MELHKDAIVALEYPTKEDKRDFGDLDEEKSMKEEDLLASLMDDLDMDDIWHNQFMIFYHFKYVNQKISKYLFLNKYSSLY